jgi:hypothetical protein
MPPLPVGCGSVAVCTSLHKPLTCIVLIAACCVLRYGVNGNGAAQTALGKRLGKWLMKGLQQQQREQAVKVATS